MCAKKCYTVWVACGYSCLNGVDAMVKKAVKKTEKEKPEGYVFGRPTKYKKEFCEIAVDFLGTGKSMVQLGRKLGVAQSTMREWKNDYPDFSTALESGKDFSQSHWEDELEKMMFNKEVNAPLAKLYFANRFKWTDKVEEEVKQPDKMVVEIIRAGTEL
jgi:hypothetical protein